MPFALVRLAAASVALALVAGCGGKSTPAPPPAPPTAWQRFVPGDYAGGTLTVGVPALAADERLAVLLLNAGGDENSSATVTTSGTGSPTSLLALPLASMAAAASASGAGDSADRAGFAAGEAQVSGRRELLISHVAAGRVARAVPVGLAPEAALAPAAVAMPNTVSFCVGQYASAGSTVYHWQGATLGYETAHAAFYSTDEVAPAMVNALAARPDFFTSLGDRYEASTTGILAALNTYFGPESDIDGNGKMIFLFANLGMDPASGGFPVGYFWPGDVWFGAASSTTCTGTFGPNTYLEFGNVADMLYLLDPGNFTKNWGGTGVNYKGVLDKIVDGVYPSTMAHELQHDVNFNKRFLVAGAPGRQEALWLNEGLSMLSETVAGYGLHTANGRGDVRSYQGFKSGTNVPYYQGYSMTVWESDPYGNYSGVQAYMQYLLDHASPAMTMALENATVTGKANVEAATGVPWDLGFARFATAAMFSNEDRSANAGGVVASAGNQLASAEFNYLGDGVSPDYTPWHHYTGYCTDAGGTTLPQERLAYVAWTPLATTASATLRTDGWAAFATGLGSGGAATITVDSAAAVKPQVVVVKFTGKLPNYTPPSAACP